MLTLCLKTQRRSLFCAVFAFCFVASGCRKAAAPSTSNGARQTANPSSSAAKHPLTRDQIKDLFDLKSHPDAIILHPVDPNALTESQRKYGVAPTPIPRWSTNPASLSWNTVTRPSVLSAATG
jgi:hypothetical protein